ncbi:MAG: MtnX-like HAD-IB family phosphatase [Dehalococcoidales bacterium]|nr:MtnX-like HAD-IB family phosphatase [Dehalococcoidales bacterium]
MMQPKKKLIVQCDFDGTVTDADVSFLLLDNFTDGNWRKLLDEYHAGRIPVGLFNSRVFSMIKADKQTMLDFIFQKGMVKIRPGFPDLLGYCSRNGIKVVIVSNGIDFYIEAILKDLGVNGIKVHAARSHFNSGGMAVEYIGPDGKPIQESFKESYTRLFREKGYEVVYIGDGLSDIHPAKRANYVFARAELLHECRAAKLTCTPFNDFNDVVKCLERLP